jgi:hypothetical protein
VRGFKRERGSLQIPVLSTSNARLIISVAKRKEKEKP